MSHRMRQRLQPAYVAHDLGNVRQRDVFDSSRSMIRFIHGLK